MDFDWGEGGLTPGIAKYFELSLEVKYMERKTVKSSNIESVGYDSLNSTLEVEFRGGRIYRYLGVPSQVYKELMESRSKGTFLNQMVKDK